MSPSSFIEAIKIYAFDKLAWEKICDMCGRCCFERTVDDDNYISIDYSSPCEFFDLDSHKCRIYKHRIDKCEDCHMITPFTLLKRGELPDECAYVKRFA